LSINLALILTLLTAFTGAVMLLDKFLWKDSGRGTESAGGARGTLVEYSRSFFPVLLIVLVIRSFVFEPFRIPSGSMMPTLLQGDFIFVKKFSYGLRLPVTETKILETGSPERGDVIVFRLPQNPSVNYIKRVIGLPGDTVVYAEHRLTINGEQVQLERSADVPNGAPVYIEHLQDRSHEILIMNSSYSVKDGVYEVPDGHYFVMGDNRDNSKDSRFIEAIPESHLVGEAVRVWMHMDGLSWPRWDRIGTKIQ
jgi:signal peptidase I